MEKTLKKVELGCGGAKTPGYIGVDRFPLPGVDIIADMNQRLPFEDNSVDVIYACHSLEHLDNLEQIASEIYRICRDKSIVQILSPYDNTSLNRANFYHKIRFNEDTYRFLTTYLTVRIDKEDYDCPHAIPWGLAASDNSQADFQLEPLRMEFFYYKEYRHMNAEQKRHARRSLQNVCDQFFCVLVVNKTGKPFTAQEMEEFAETAKTLEPERIATLRQRDLQYYDGESLINDISEPLLKKQEELQGSNQKLLALCGELQKQLQKQKEENIANLAQLKKLEASSENREKCWENLISLECHKQLAHSEQTFHHGRVAWFSSRRNVFPVVQQSSPVFTDQLILNCPQFRQHSLLIDSPMLTEDSYIEFDVLGYGERIHFWLEGIPGAQILAETVSKGKIIGQDIITFAGEGSYQAHTTGVKGAARLRLRALDHAGLVKTLEIANRWMLWAAKIDLAAYID